MAELLANNEQVSGRGLVSGPMDGLRKIKLNLKSGKMASQLKS